ncbi:MAG: acylneuraminate cytidylyltransferase family protein [Kiritimatiellales bacterium]|nr:acylneuraminate cytidylyltransferase family protein [Kiritimatiellales bacterium]
MQNNSDVLGIIIARGGSIRIPKKNILPVNGKPLISYTCEAATQSKFITRVVLSTDNEEIVGIGRACNVEIPFMRPNELAGEESDAMDAVYYTINELEKQEQYTPSLVVLLQPTSPLRTAAHIDEGIALQKHTDADCVVSVKEIHYLQSPKRAMTITEGKLDAKPYESAKNAEKFYAYNGAVYVFTRDHLLQSKNPFSGNCVPLIMDQESSIDIDTQIDLELAELLLKKKSQYKNR